MNKFAIIEPEIKKNVRIMPFVTFPLTKKCNFKCQYCGYGGELSASMKESQEYEKLVKKIFIAHNLGVRKFRFTGGEPFMYPHISDLIELFNDLGVYLLINTNGSLIKKYSNLFQNMQDNIHFAVSLDTLQPDIFDKMTGTKNNFNRVIDGIEIIKDSGRLYRLNMVVNTLNEDDIFNIIDYCYELECNLKLLDVVSVPLPYGNRNDLHVPFIELEKKLSLLSTSVKNHQYARSFGTPCKIYKYKGVNITVKSTWNGSRYDYCDNGNRGICNDCTYFPCHEGLYDIFSLPDERLAGCRWSEESVEKTGESFKAQLVEIAKLFQSAVYIPREQNLAMQPKPDFVVNSLKNAGIDIPITNTVY